MYTRCGWAPTLLVRCRAFVRCAQRSLELISTIGSTTTDTIQGVMRRSRALRHCGVARCCRHTQLSCMRSKPVVRGTCSASIVSSASFRRCRCTHSYMIGGLLRYNDKGGGKDNATDTEVTSHAVCPLSGPWQRWTRAYCHRVDAETL